MLYLLLLKRSLAYKPRPLSGLVRISVEEDRASNRLSGGCSTGGEELSCLGVDEERTWDFTSFTCLLARISAKDILLSVDGTALVFLLTGPTGTTGPPGISRSTSHSAPTNSDKTTCVVFDSTPRVYHAFSTATRLPHHVYPHRAYRRRPIC